MISFKEFLQEVNINFAKGYDQDFTVHPTKVLVFSEKEAQNYKEKGKTHGLMSHAIKHLKEFEPEFVAQQIALMRSEILKQIKTTFQDVKVWNYNSGFNKAEGIDALKSASDDVLLNTLDVINDKNQEKEKLLPIEKLIKKYAVALEHKYNEIISLYIGSAVELDNVPEENIENLLKTSDIVKFEGFGRVANDYWLNFKNKAIIIGTPDKIRSMFIFSNADSRKDMAKKFFSKKFKATKPAINNALRTL